MSHYRSYGDAGGPDRYRGFSAGYAGEQEMQSFGGTQSGFRHGVETQRLYDPHMDNPRSFEPRSSRGIVAPQRYFGRGGRSYELPPIGEYGASYRRSQPPTAEGFYGEPVRQFANTSTHAVGSHLYTPTSRIASSHIPSTHTPPPVIYVPRSNEQNLRFVTWEQWHIQQNSNSEYLQRLHKLEDRADRIEAVLGSQYQPHEPQVAVSQIPARFSTNDRKFEHLLTTTGTRIPSLGRDRRPTFPGEPPALTIFDGMDKKRFNKGANWRKDEDGRSVVQKSQTHQRAPRGRRPTREEETTTATVQGSPVANKRENMTARQGRDSVNTAPNDRADTAVDDEIFNPALEGKSDVGDMVMSPGRAKHFKTPIQGKANLDQQAGKLNKTPGSHKKHKTPKKHDQTKRKNSRAEFIPKDKTKIKSINEEVKLEVHPAMENKTPIVEAEAINEKILEQNAVDEHEVQQGDAQDNLDIQEQIDRITGVATSSVADKPESVKEEHTSMIEGETQSQTDHHEQQEARFKFNPGAVEFKYGKTDEGKEPTPEDLGYHPEWSFGQSIDFTYRQFERKWYDQGRNPDFSRPQHAAPAYARPIQYAGRAVPVWGEHYTRPEPVYTDKTARRPLTPMHGHGSLDQGMPAENRFGNGRYAMPATQYGQPSRLGYQQYTPEGTPRFAPRQSTNRQGAPNFAPRQNWQMQGSSNFAPRQAMRMDGTSSFAPRRPMQTQDGTSAQTGMHGTSTRAENPRRAVWEEMATPPPGGWRAPPVGGWKDEYAWSKYVTPGPTVPGTQLAISPRLPEGSVKAVSVAGSKLSAHAAEFISQPNSEAGVAEGSVTEASVTEAVEVVSDAIEAMSIATDEFTIVDKQEGVATAEGSEVSAVAEQAKTRSWADDSESEDEIMPEVEEPVLAPVESDDTAEEKASVVSEKSAVVEQVKSVVDKAKADVKGTESTKKKAWKVIQTKAQPAPASPVPMTPISKSKVVEQPATTTKVDVPKTPVTVGKEKDSEWTTVGRSKKLSRSVSPATRAPEANTNVGGEKKPSSWANLVSSPPTTGLLSTPRAVQTTQGELNSPTPMKAFARRKMYIPEVPQGTSYAEILGQMRGGIIDDVYVSGLSPELHQYTQVKGRAQNDGGSGTWFGYVTFYSETGLMRCIQHLNNTDHKVHGTAIPNDRGRPYQPPGVAVAHITLKDRRFPVYIRERDQRPLQDDTISAVTKFGGTRVLNLTFKKSIRCKAPHTGNMATWESWRRAFTQDDGKEALVKIQQAIQIWKGCPEVYVESIEQLPAQTAAVEGRKSTVPKTYLGSRDGETFKVKVCMLRISVAQKVFQYIQADMQFRDHCLATYGVDHCSEEITTFEKFVAAPIAASTPVKKRLPKPKKKKSSGVHAGDDEEFPPLPASGKKQANEHKLELQSEDAGGQVEAVEGED